LVWVLTVPVISSRTSKVQWSPGRSSSNESAAFEGWTDAEEDEAAGYPSGGGACCAHAALETRPIRPKTT